MFGKLGADFTNGQHTSEGAVSPSSHLLQDETRQEPSAEHPHIVEEGKTPFASSTSEIQAIGNTNTSAQSWSTIAVVLSAIVPLVALIAWLAKIRMNKNTFDTFAGEAIGGRLSQGQAKAIDIVCGAILAPLLMASVNVLWFDSARVSAVNEQQRKAIPLQSLITVSGICSGSFDLITLRNLLQGKTWRLFLLASLTLLSALARTSLANIIAYEAYTTTEPFAESPSLRLQRDAAVERSYLNGGLFPQNVPGLDLYDFTAAQQADIAKQISALFTEMAFENATSKLTDGTYIAANVTAASLAALPLSVVSLDNVPAYRLSVDCTPDLPDQISVMQPFGEYHSVTQVSSTWVTTAAASDSSSSSSSSSASLFQANYPGTPSDIQTGDGDDYSFIGFSLGGGKEAYLSRLNRFNLTNDTVASPYGEIRHRAFNLSQWGFDGTQSTMSVSGLRCALSRETGALNYTRRDNSTTATTSSSSSSSSSSPGAWSITHASFDAATKTAIPSLLIEWQTNLAYRAPLANNPGIGAALSSRGGSFYDNAFGDYALNYLYASGEVQRITYEVAASASPTNTTLNPPEYFYSVAGTGARERYRMTYVPSVLLAGLLSMLLAAGVAAGMAAGAAGSVSGRAFRRVDAARLLVDGVVGLKGEGEELAVVGAGSNEVVERWVGECKVRYAVVGDRGAGGSVRVVLEKV